jgi:hypothetical protein
VSVNSRTCLVTDGPLTDYFTVPVADPIITELIDTLNVIGVL